MPVIYSSFCAARVLLWLPVTSLTWLNCHSKLLGKSLESGFWSFYFCFHVGELVIYN
uniref:Uncharacterized protein n=2 Tax=Anguilla anguilla TaxID=7936 RepID=A0A0E9SUP1_ANGAN